MQSGLYWARWTETHKGPAEEIRTYSLAVPSGNVSVQQEGLPDPEAGCGKVAAIAR